MSESIHPAMLLEEIRLLRGEIDALRADLAARNAPAESIPEAYDLPEAQKLLGGVSRSTIYRDVHKGLLNRVPGTRRVLITRKSIAARIQTAA